MYKIWPPRSAKFWVSRSLWPRNLTFGAPSSGFLLAKYSAEFRPSPILIKCSESLGWGSGFPPILRVAPRVAPRIGFSNKLGHGCHSESWSEDAREFGELLREWPFHSDSVFFKIGVVPRFLNNPNTL